MTSFEPPPPPTLANAADSLRHLLGQIDELARTADKLASSLRLQKIHLERAAAGIKEEART
jgi:hypothetical protein